VHSGIFWGGCGEGAPAGNEKGKKKRKKRGGPNVAQVKAAVGISGGTRLTAPFEHVVGHPTTAGPAAGKGRKEKKKGGKEKKPLRRRTTWPE